MNKMNKGSAQFSIRSLLERVNRWQTKPILYLPSAVTFLRLSALPILTSLMYAGQVVPADLVFLLAIFSDLADGYLARKLKVSSKFGANFDACVDFLFIGGVFLYFTIERIYPAWVLLTIVAMFVQFLLSSKLTHVMFDPVGKYYGSLLYGAIGLTMLFPGQSARFTIMIAFACVSIASISSRLIFYFNHYGRGK